MKDEQFHRKSQSFFVTMAKSAGNETFNTANREPALGYMWN